MNTVKVACNLVAAFLAGPASSAECISPGTPGCSVYEECFAKHCPCTGDKDEYFIRYGSKYCASFLANPNFGPAGRRWRNATLICLQERIVPALPKSARHSCNCKAMRKLAFESHVRCYTQPKSSICDLPEADVRAIAQVIDMKDLFADEGWKQMQGVAAICRTKAPNDGRRTRWIAVATVLGVP